MRILILIFGFKRLKSYLIILSVHKYNIQLKDYNWWNSQQICSCLPRMVRRCAWCTVIFLWNGINNYKRSLLLNALLKCLKKDKGVFHISYQGRKNKISAPNKNKRQQYSYTRVLQMAQTRSPNCTWLTDTEILKKSSRPLWPRRKMTKDKAPALRRDFRIVFLIKLFLLLQLNALT